MLIEIEDPLIRLKKSGRGKCEEYSNTEAGVATSWGAEKKNWRDGWEREEDRRNGKRSWGSY